MVHYDQGMFDTLEAIRGDSSRFTLAVEGNDLSAPVPSCPGWSVRDLIEHLGEVQRFWADNVRAGDAGEPSRYDHPIPGSDDELVRWMRASTEELLGALGDSSEGAPCWTWWNAPRTCGAVARHQVQEAAVHRWDAEAAVGDASPIDAAAADDGVAEFLEIMLGSTASTMPGSVSLVADDTGGEWIVGDQRGPHTVVRASASDLVLLLYGRLPQSADGIKIEGDANLLGELLGSADTD
jgi:uncharacterized protein (TIGR03083 family)